MPLTAKGKKIKRAMEKPKSQGGYGAEGETIFYKTEAKGKLKGLTKKRKKKKG